MYIPFPSGHAIARSKFACCGNFDKNQLLIQVRYRLEVDEFTVVFDDLRALGDKIDLQEPSRTS